MAITDSASIFPGQGGKQTFAMIGGQTSGDIDVSLNDSFAVVLTSETGTNAVQVEQSFDLVNWKPLGVKLAAAGDTLKIDDSDAPHGYIRLVQTGTGSCIVTIVGFPSHSQRIKL